MATKVTKKKTASKAAKKAVPTKVAPPSSKPAKKPAPIVDANDDVANLPAAYTAPLVKRNLKVLAIGTSITWGAGLRSIDKYAYVLGQKIAVRQKQRFPGGLALAHYARCGAKLWQHDIGEGDAKTFTLAADPAPSAGLKKMPAANKVRRNNADGDCGTSEGFPFLWEQAGQAVRDFAAEGTRPDVIVLDAGANDVDFVNAVVLRDLFGGNSFHSSIELVYARIAAMKENLENLLAHIENELGGVNTPILLCGYYRAIGPAFVTSGAHGGVAKVFQQLQVDAGVLHLRESLVTAMEAFERLFRQEWSALAERMRRTGAAKYANVYFVDVEFGGDHGLGSISPWVFPNVDGAADDRASYRRCANPIDRTCGACFHPNALGAARYASSCYQKLLELGW